MMERTGWSLLPTTFYGDNFAPLRDRLRFADFYLDYGLATIAWDTGADSRGRFFLYERLSAMH